MANPERRNKLAENGLRGMAEEDKRHTLIDFNTSSIVDQA
jgi:hypothetical protein